jgi:flagellar motor switch protein FliN
LTDSTKQPGDESLSTADVSAAAKPEAAENTGPPDEPVTDPSEDQAVAHDEPSAQVARSKSKAASVDLRGFDIPELNDVEGGENASTGHRVTMLSDVNLNVRIELGRTRMLVEEVLSLGEGSVVELDKIAGDPVDVYVNDRLVARGEVLVLNDNFCVRINDVLSRDPHRVMT